MEHIVRIITPPGALVLDPFAGSGSTGVAATWARFLASSNPRISRHRHTANRRRHPRRRMTFLDRLSNAFAALAGKAAPAGTGGSSWTGGTVYADAFGAKRAPTPARLVESYKSIVYTCANLNAQAVSASPLRLFATTATGQKEPRRTHVSVTAATRKRLAASPLPPPRRRKRRGRGGDHRSSDSRRARRPLPRLRPRQPDLLP